MATKLAESPATLLERLCVALGEVKCCREGPVGHFGGAGVGVFLGLRAKSLHQVCLKAIALGALGTACSYGSKMIVNPPFDSKKQYNGMYAYMPQAEGK